MFVMMIFDVWADLLLMLNITLYPSAVKYEIMAIARRDGHCSVGAAMEKYLSEKSSYYGRADQRR